MRLLTKAAFAALLLGSTAIAAPAFADDTGCPPGLHRADFEGGMKTTRPAALTLKAVKTMRSARPTPRAVRTTRSPR